MAQQPTALPTNVGPLEPSAPGLHPRTLIGQGLMMGWGDDLESWVRSKLSGKPQEQIRQEIMSDVKRYAQQYPASAATQEFVGAALPSLFASGLPVLESATLPRTVGALEAMRKTLAFNPEAPVASSTRLGALTGGIGGAGVAEPGERTVRAGLGALTGAGLGFAVPVTAGTIGNVGSFVMRNLLPPSDKATTRMAEQKLVELMRNEGVEPRSLTGLAEEDYGRILNDPRALGIPSKIAHYTPAATENIITQGGAAEVAKLEKTLRGIQRGQKGRVEGKFKAALEPGDYYADLDTMTNQLRQNARGMYDQAYAVGTVDDPRILQVLENPTFKKAFEEAKAISQTEKSAAQLAGEDTSAFDLKDIYVPKEVHPGVYDLELAQAPDVRTLDYIKRGIDAVIERGYKGEGMSSAQANALRKLRNQYVAVLDEVVPEYKAARVAYKGDLEIKDALEIGKTAYNRMDPEQIRKFMDNASEAEKEAFRTGAMRYLQNNIFEKPNAAGTIVNSRKNVDKLQAMFDTPEEFALVKAALDKEAMLYANAERALSGSRTEIKKRGVDILNEAPRGAASKAAGGAGNLIGSVMSVLRGQEKLPLEVMGKMADMLNAGSPNEVAAVVKALEKRELMTNRAARAGAAAIGGAVAGSSGGTAIPEVDPEISAGDILRKEVLDYYNSWKMRGASQSE